MLFDLHNVFRLVISFFMLIGSFYFLQAAIINGDMVTINNKGSLDNEALMCSMSTICYVLFYVSVFVLQVY